MTLSLLKSSRKVKVTSAVCTIYSLISSSQCYLASALSTSKHFTTSLSSSYPSALSKSFGNYKSITSICKISTTQLMMSSSISNLTTTSSLTVSQIPCLSDNYGYLIHDPKTGHTAAVDTPDASAYEQELKARGWKLSHIFNTHHHWDHTGGNEELKKNHDVIIHGPSNESIPGCDVQLSGGDTVTSFGGGDTEIQIIDVGGHTNGHIAYYFPKDNLVFCGDALFALGCGRMFEGTPSQFWDSLKRLRALPDETVVYCAHEYTQSNAKFAMSVEPGNSKLVSRTKEIIAKRQRGEATVPSMMGEEKQTNPFLRVDISDEIRSNVGAVSGESEDEVFGKVRKAKDNFRG